MAVNRNLGAPGTRTTDEFQAFAGEVGAKLDTLPSDFSAHAGRPIRVDALGQGPTPDGPIDLRTDLVRGGRVAQVDAPPGDWLVPVDETGVRRASRNAVDVTWTVSADALTGTILPWVQLGAGVLTFDVTVGGALEHPLGHTTSAGLRCMGQLEVIDRTPEGKAVWRLSGETAE